MKKGFTIKNSMPVELENFNFQVADGDIQSIRIDTEESYDSETAEDIKAVLDDNLTDYNLTLSPMKDRIQVRVQ